MEQQSLNDNEKFEDLKYSKKVLSDSRTEIDRIDNELIDLINKRTSLANDIIRSKIALNMDIHDEERENLIYERVIKLANDKNLNENTKNSVLEIMNILIDLSKTEQEEIINKRD